MVSMIHKTNNILVMHNGGWKCKRMIYVGSCSVQKHNSRGRPFEKCGRTMGLKPPTRVLWSTVVIAVFPFWWHSAESWTLLSTLSATRYWHINPQLAWQKPAPFHVGVQKEQFWSTKGDEDRKSKPASPEEKQLHRMLCNCLCLTFMAIKNHACWQQEQWWNAYEFPSNFYSSLLPWSSALDTYFQENLGTYLCHRIHYITLQGATNYHNDAGFSELVTERDGIPRASHLRSWRELLPETRAPPPLALLPQSPVPVSPSPSFLHLLSVVVYRGSRHPGLLLNI